MSRVRPGLVSVLVLAGALGLSAAKASAAPIGWQISGGWQFRDSPPPGSGRSIVGQVEPFLGAGVRLSAGTSTLVPNVEWLFVDRAHVYAINLDWAVDVLPMQVATGYLGAGLGMFTVDHEDYASDTDMVLNVIAGAGFNTVPLKPFAQLKYVFRDGGHPLVLSIGARLP